MKTRRILSVVLAVMMVLSAFTFASVSVSADTSVIYVDQTNGADSNSGTDAAHPVKTMASAFGKVDDGGTIVVKGLYNCGSTSFPATTKFVTIEGYDVDSVIETGNGFGLMMNSDLAFANIKMFGGGSGHAHLNTNGHLLIAGEGFEVIGNGQIHVGNMSGNTTSEHVIIDGANVTKAMSIGGAYLSDSSKGIKGDATVEVLSGSLATLKYGQDGWQTSHAAVTIEGNANVRIGKNGKINKMDNQTRPATVKGYLQLILEDGATMPALDMTNFVNKQHYEIKVDGSENGKVDFTSVAGTFNITPNAGYVVKVDDGTSVNYITGGEYVAPLGKAVNVSFTNEKKIAPNAVDLIVEKAVPGTTDWPVYVDDTTHFDVVVNAITPDDATVGYAIPYKYELELVTVDPYVFPADFAFTINGTSDYRIEKISESYDSRVFRYTAEMTDKDTTRAMISYVGGIGTAGTAPYNSFADRNTQIVVEANPFTQGGYRFDGFSDGTNIYQPGDTYQLGDDDVVFTAVWTKLDKLQVIFDGNGANAGFAPDGIEDYEGMYVEIPENTFAYTGYNFKYWTDASGKIYKPGELVLLSGGNLYLSANWEVSPVAGQKVYVDVLAGLDSNDGLTKDTAVATLAKAVSIANGGNVTVIVIGNLSVNGELPANAGNVTITGYDNDAALLIANNISFGSDTIIENIKIKASEGAYIATNGYKAVIGPNLENIGYTEGANSKLIRFDLVDGAIDGTVENINTEIKSGVSIGTYYLGGADHTAANQGVTGNSTVTISGADIETVDFAPKGANSEAAKMDGYLIFTVNSGNIANFKATQAFVRNRTVAGYIFFNNGTIPQLSSSVITTLKNGRQRLFMFDSGLGGHVEIYDYAESNFRAGKVTPVPNDATMDSFYSKNGGNYTKYNGTTPVAGVALATANSITKIRYGTAMKDDIEATIVSPTGGAETFSITATPVDANLLDVVSIQLDGWSPETPGGKFKYEVQYSANVLITLSEGYFFDFKKLPAVIINGEAAVVTLNTDGTLSATYQFPEKTAFAPLLSVKYEAGSTSVVGEVPAAQSWEHMATGNLAKATTMSNLGYYFAGWKCSADGKTYRAGASFTYTSNDEEVTFTAQWLKRGGWELPSVVIINDLSALGRDRGRNPKFDADAEEILLSKPFANLEYDLNGKKSTVWSNYDYEKVVALTSDGKGKGLCINDYTLNRAKVDPTEYKYVTIIYYYETENDAAVGDYGSINFGNLILADGSKSNWYGKEVKSQEPVVANKWACVTFDLTQVVEDNDMPAGSMLNQFHIYPIGRKSCADLGECTLYLKAMYFSKTPAITK